MKAVKQKVQFNGGWCFALINNRLAEIFFDKEWGLYGYCYVKRDEYSKGEQRRINKDLQKHQFSYRNAMFYDKTRNITFPLGEVQLKKGDLLVLETLGSKKSGGIRK